MSILVTFRAKTSIAFPSWLALNHAGQSEAI